MTDRSDTPFPVSPAKARSRSSQPSRSSRSSSSGRKAEEARRGDTKFDEWYDNPLFESDPDERLEEMATSKRGPMQAAASVLLRVDARTARLRGRAPSPVASPVPAVAGDGGHESGEQFVAAPSRPATPKWRARLGQAIDRWAEQEEQTQRRIERVLLPKRWQT